MIIKKKNISAKETSSKEKTIRKKGNVIKKDDVILNIDDVKNSNIELLNESKKSDKSAAKGETFEKIDISSIEFKERIERRRGDRRRGYRRIDERSLVSRAQQEAHSIKELAAREGYKNGIAQAQGEIEQLKSSIEEFLGLRDEMYKDFYPHIMEIAMEISKNIIKKEVELSNDVLKNIAMSVMDEISSDVQKVTIKVNSSDMEFSQASLPELIAGKNVQAKISFAADDTIEKGSCMIIANNGVIDANFKTQLAVLQSAFGIYKGGL